MYDDYSDDEYVDHDTDCVDDFDDVDGGDKDLGVPDYDLDHLPSSPL